MSRDRAKRSVTVTIAGQKLAMKSDAAESYVRDLAGHVDEKLRELLGGVKVATYGHAVLAAMGIADELFRERAERRSLRRRVRERVERLVRALDGASAAAEE